MKNYKSINCANCVQRVEIRSGARTYFKCDWLDKFMDIDNEDPLKGCPYKKKKK